MPGGKNEGPGVRKPKSNLKEGVVDMVHQPPALIPEVVSSVEGLGDFEISGLEGVLGELSEAGISISDKVKVKDLPELGRLLTMIADGYLKENLQKDEMPMASRPVENARGWTFRSQSSSSLTVGDIRKGIRESKEKK